MGAASKAAALVVYLCAGGACVALGWFAHAFWGVSAPVPRGMTSRATFVAVGEVASEKFNPPEEFVGHVEPVQEVDILPQIDGYIQRVCFTEGETVKKGDLLFEIDAEQYLAAKNLRYSEVASAEAKVIVARAEVDRAAVQRPRRVLPAPL